MRPFENMQAANFKHTWLTVAVVATDQLKLEYKYFVTKALEDNT